MELVVMEACELLECQQVVVQVMMEPLMVELGVESLAPLFRLMVTELL